MRSFIFSDYSTQTIYQSLVAAVEDEGLSNSRSGLHFYFLWMFGLFQANCNVLLTYPLMLYCLYAIEQRCDYNELHWLTFCQRVAVRLVLDA